MINIRKACRSDSDALYTMASSLATSFTVDAKCFESVLAQLLDEQAAGRALIILAEIDGVAAGYAMGYLHQAFYANGPISWLEELYVAEKHRGNGVGRKLLAAFESWAKDNGARLNAVATRRAEAFYNACDYELSARYFKKAL